MIFNKKTFFLRVGLSFASLAALFFLLSCFSSKPFKTARLSIATSAGKTVDISVEIAATEEERGQGLMFRKKIEDGKGMIFLFEKDQIMSFWMKNTLVPLSIAFILSDGRIAEIRDMEPQSLAAVNSERSCRYALETPQGWFARSGVGVGDKLSVESLSPENLAQ
ncbi:MAG: DUF192 domain-containing protein [Treponema sp.]|nr:DUF192 domain-containing protein [Treponema sp.]